jgi:hypothetical protein
MVALAVASASQAAGPINELPVCNTPRELRQVNYKGGSCVHASSSSSFNWDHEYELGKYWHETYSGGESYNGLTSKLRKNNILFYSTANGDVSVLERASAERRMAVIFYFPSHSINCVGIDKNYAYLLDNNRVNEWIVVPRATFERNWRGYGGVAVVPQVGVPLPPIPWKKK